MFIPFLFFIGSVLLGLLTYILYRKIKHGVKYSYEKGTDIANQQQQKWKKKDQLKKQPSIVKQGFADLEIIENIYTKLPEEWQTSLNPLILTAREILDTVAYDPDFETNKLTLMRSFFIHTLDALKQFSQKLASDYKYFKIKLPFFL
jgi:hypothetical protein